MGTVLQVPQQRTGAVNGIFMTPAQHGGQVGAMIMWPPEYTINPPTVQQLQPTQPPKTSQQQILPKPTQPQPQLIIEQSPQPCFPMSPTEATSAPTVVDPPEMTATECKSEISVKDHLSL